MVDSSGGFDSRFPHLPLFFSVFLMFYVLSFSRVFLFYGSRLPLNYCRDNSFFILITSFNI